MNTFSKPISKNQQKPITDKKVNHEILTYQDYFSKNIDLKKYTIPVLKCYAKQYALHVSGTKSILIERIHQFLVKHRAVIMIQTYARMFLVKNFWNIRGPALIKRELCVNDTDFNSLDPIKEIEFYDFYSYRDNAGFIYGFNLKSIILMFKKTGDIINPYNREKIHMSQIRKIVSLYKWSLNLQKGLKHKNTFISDNNHENSVISNTNVSNRRDRHNYIINHRARHIARNYHQNNNNNNNNDDNDNDNDDDDNNDNDNTNEIVLLNNHIGTNEHHGRRSRVLANLDEMRNNSIDRRARDLFIEIDSLGNYTNVSWFMNLTIVGYIRFIQTLHDIWSWHANMTNITRSRICPYCQPFSYGVTRSNIFLNRNPNIYYLKINCLTIMENIVFSGGNAEDRKLGIIHILSALTMVSSGARQATPWLFEAIAFEDITYNETEHIPYLIAEFMNPAENNIQNDEIPNNDETMNVD